MIQYWSQLRTRFSKSPSKGTIWLLLLFLAVLALGYVIAQGTRPRGPSSVVSRYIGALQRRDLKTIIDLTESYQAEVARIKSQNPQALWSKLIAEYYEAKSSQLAEDPGFWINFAGATIGDPTQSIRAVAALLPSSCKWVISETRIRKASQTGGLAYTEGTVYADVSYPSLETSPEIAKKFLKHTILEFAVHDETGLVMSITKVGRADVYWTKPYTPAATAFLQTKYQSELLAARTKEEARATIGRLLDAGWDQAEPVLLESLNHRSAFFTESVSVLGEHQDGNAVPGIMAALKEKFEGKIKEPGCDEGSMLLMSTLRKIGKTTSADFGLLREALSNTISAGIHSAGLNTLQREDTDCVNGYLLTMSAFDDPAWQSFPYSYSGIVYATEGNWGGGSVFWKVLEPLSLGSRSADLLDRSSPNTTSALAYVRQLPPCNGNPGHCRIGYLPDYIRVASPAKAERFGEIEEYDELFSPSNRRIIGHFKSELQRSNDPAKPWLIEDIRKYDGQGG